MAHHSRPSDECGPLRVGRWCILLFLILAFIAPHLACAQSNTNIEAIYDPQNSLREGSIRWPAFITTDKAVDSNGDTITFAQDAALPIDEWILMLGVDWTTGEVRGTMSGSASLGDRVAQLYESCWASHAGQCAGTATFNGTIVDGHAEPHGDRGQWRICFVVEGTVNLRYEFSHFVHPWTEGLADDGASTPPKERVALSRAEIAGYRQFFTGIIYPPDGERHTVPILQLLTKKSEIEDGEDGDVGPYLIGMGPQFTFTRGFLPEVPPVPGPAMGVCEAAQAAGTIAPTHEEHSDGAEDVEQPLNALSVSIGLSPDPPVLDRVVIFRPEVHGNSPQESLRYAWQLDGEPLGTDESAQWNATLGEHVVSLNLQSDNDPERAAVASLSFVVTRPLPTKDEDTAPGASFAMGSLICTDEISSDDTLTCTASWTRNEDSDLGALFVQWYVDGASASQENNVGQSATFSLAQPAPGEHSVQVRLVDPASDAQAARTISIHVTPGNNARVPVSARAVAALGSSGTVAGWLWLEWRRARQAAVLAARRAQAQKAAEAALSRNRQAWYDAQMRQNDHERQQRREREAAAALDNAENDYAQAASRAHQIAREAADLTRHLQRLRADYDYTRYTAVSDGVMDMADLVIDVGLTASGKAPGWLGTPAGAGAKDWAKGLAKGAIRQKLGEMVDGRPPDYDPLAEALSAAGLPPDYIRTPRDTTSKRGWDRIGYDLAPRGALKQAYVRHLDRVPLSPVQRVGKALGPVESALTGVHHAASKADQAARLRQRIVVADQQLRRRNQIFAEALKDLAAKRSALEKARDAARTLKGTSP